MSAPTVDQSTAVDLPGADRGVRPQVSPALRQTPLPLTLAASGVALGMVLMRGTGPFSEPDVWWHLRVGEQIIRTHDLVGPDPWAAFSDKDYVATQWLPEVVAATAYHWFGMAGVLWLRAALVIALFMTLYALARRKASRFVAAIVAAIATVGSSGGLNPRPQLVSFVLFAVVLAAWWDMAHDHRPRWWLVPVFWLWACCHGLWYLGLVVGVLVLVALLADPVVRIGRRAATRLATLLLACAAAIALTPLGPRLLLAPFEVAGNASWIAEEWRATPLNNLFAITALGMVVGVAIIWASRPAHRPWWQVAVLGLSALCTLWMWRLVPLGAALATPLLAAALQSIHGATVERVSRREWSACGAALAAALVAAAVVASSTGGQAARYPGKMREVDSALSALPAGTVLLNDFGVSGWLLWKHPELTPVVDLRGELYSTEYLRSFQRTEQVRPGWEDFLTRTGAHYALQERDAALADALTRRRGWTEVASSGNFILLHAPEASR